MSEIKVSRGIISEKALVERYGTDAQKKAYKENGKFTGTYKKALLNKLQRLCDIKEIEDNKYEITKIYKYPLPTNFKKMNDSLYKYTIPLILNNLIDEHDQYNKIDITVGKWAREINMVNSNYSLIKYNQEQASDKIKCPLSTINEFYEKSDDLINYYIRNSLDYLKSAGLIIWREVTNFTVEKPSGRTIIDENGDVVVEMELESHAASKEEMEFYASCISIADKTANIHNARERYYSDKSYLFSETLKRELYTRGVKYVYNTYEAYYINLDKSKYILKEMNSPCITKLIKSFNEEFTEKIVSNASKRYDKKSYDFLKEDYLKYFQSLCDFTVNKKARSLKNKITQKDKNENYRVEVSYNNSKEK